VDKPLRWLGGTEVKTPPVGEQARRDLGVALRVLQRGGHLSMPTSRPMPSIGTGCYELRVRDEGEQWRLIYRLDADAILLLDLVRKTTQKTPKPAIDRCRRRLRQYDDDRA
jgi:phage-related protein